MKDSVASNELLARYITSSKWFRKQDQTVKQDAFIPPESPLELSVTRQLNLPENDIWSFGRKIATSISRYSSWKGRCRNIACFSPIFECGASASGR